MSSPAQTTNNDENQDVVTVEDVVVQNHPQNQDEERSWSCAIELYLRALRVRRIRRRRRK